MTSHDLIPGIVHPKALHQGRALAKCGPSCIPDSVLATVPFPPSFQGEGLESEMWGEGVDGCAVERFVESEDEDEDEDCGQAELEALAQIELDLLGTSKSWPNDQDQPYLLRKAHTATALKPCQDDDYDDLGLDKAAFALRRSCPVRFQDVPERAMNPMCRDPTFLKGGDSALTSLVTSEEEEVRVSGLVAVRKSTRPSLFSLPSIVTSQH
jgi:hypothetical protein